MYRLILLILLLSSSLSWSQDRYRFSVGGGFHSLMFWGLRSFDEVVLPVDPGDIGSIYDYEEYNLNYHNFRASFDYTFGFSVNWFNSNKIQISQNISFFKGNFEDGLTLELTDVGTPYADPYPISEFNSSNTGIGSVTSIRYRTEIVGIKSEIVVRYKLPEAPFFVGGGIFITHFVAQDHWWNGLENALVEGYRPNYYDRGSGSYFSRQLGLTVSFMYSWKFINVFINAGNSFMTLKKESMKGKWWGDYNFFPTSHNFDFRFPLTFETGIALSFDKIKKSNW